ncbi:MAG: GTP cyclohydrolase 1 type 2 [Candidatus Hydrogenedentota bacterium]
MTVKEICAAMNRWAPPGYAYPWDKAGLNIGSPDAKVSAVITCLSVTSEVAKVARKRKANVIVSHHPVIWEPFKRLDLRDSHTQLCIELASTGVHCFSAHTNLDVVHGGVNSLLAQRIGLTNPRPLFGVPHATMLKLVTFVPEAHLHTVRRAVCEAGAGIIGDYTQCSFSAPGTGTFLPGHRTNPFSGKKLEVNEEPERRLEVILPKARQTPVLLALMSAHPYEEPAFDMIPLENADESVSAGLCGVLHKALPLEVFARQVCKALKTNHVRVAGSARKKVRTVAVFGGSGGSQIEQVPTDIDVLITGDVGYHDALAASARGLTVMDAGHCATEKWIAEAIAIYLKRECPGVRIHPVMETEPFRVVLE